MKLNNHSYVHVTIRQLCLQLELLSGMKLITNLSDDFYEVRFVDKFGYIVIDWRKSACFSLSHKLTPKEMETIKDMLLNLDWLETAEKIKDEREKRLWKKVKD